MGKRLITQRRGKGTFTYKSHSHRYKGRITNPVSKETLKGEIFDVIKCPGHTAPLAKIIYEDGQQVLIPAPANVRIKDKISIEEDKISLYGKAQKRDDLIIFENRLKKEIGDSKVVSPVSNLINEKDFVFSLTLYIQNEE